MEEEVKAEAAVESPNAVLIKLLAEAQAEMPNPKKDTQGQTGHQTYKYATLDQVIEIVKKPLNSRGIFLTQPSALNAEGRMVVQTVVFYEGVQLVLDSKPYEYDSDPKEFGKRETYARRYSLLTAFGLAGEEDTDGDTGPAKPARKSPARKEAKKPDRRTRMLAKIAGLRTQLMERGLSQEGLDAYLQNHYKVDGPDGLSDEQLEDYGRQLASAVSNYKGEGQK